jgi:hypothetical protein
LKEFSFTFEEGLNKGLRPDVKVPRNMQYLEEAYNVKMGRAGNQPFAPLSEVVNDYVDTKIAAELWPYGPLSGVPGAWGMLGTNVKYPFGYQLFQTRSGLYCATPERIMFFDKSGPRLALYPRNVLPPPAWTGWYPTQIVQVPDADDYNIGSWQVADFGQYRIWLDCENSWLYYEKVRDIPGTRNYQPYRYYGLLQWGAYANYVPIPIPPPPGGGTAHCFRYTMIPRAICSHNNTLFMAFRGLVVEEFDENPWVVPYPVPPYDWTYIGAKYHARFQNMFVALTPGKTNMLLAAMFAAGSNNYIDITFAPYGTEGGVTVLDLRDLMGHFTTHMSWNGMIDHMKPLGNDIVVYGSRFMPLSGPAAVVPPLGQYGEDYQFEHDIGGVSLMTFKSPGAGIVGWGETVLSMIGVPRGRPVAGNIYKHLYVDVHGVLWLLEAGGKKTRLGYEEYIKPLMTVTTGEDLVFVSYDEKEDEFYISSAYTAGAANTTYLLSKNGLSKVYQAVMSIASYNKYDAVTGTYPTTTECTLGQNSTDLTGSICTQKMDMGTRAIKTITGLEIGAQNSAAMTANIDYKYSTSDAFVTSTPKPVHKNGTVTPMIAGTDFKVRVESISYVDFDLDYMSIRWKLNDKRLIRGLHESTSSKAVSGSGG